MPPAYMLRYSDLSSTIDPVLPAVNRAKQMSVLKKIDTYNLTRRTASADTSLGCLSTTVSRKLYVQL